MAQSVCICMFDVAIAFEVCWFNHTLPVLADLWKKNYNLSWKKRARLFRGCQLTLIRQVGAHIHIKCSPISLGRCWVGRNHCEGHAILKTQFSNGK